MKVRIKFSKYGVMKFIGHLDVMRFFQKAIRRADIDIRYSEGFSPHQIMSFAAPLGVGIESMGEYLDIEVNSMTSTKEMEQALNAVMVEGISVLSVKILPDTVKNAMASVAAAEYQVAYRKEFSEEKLQDDVQEMVKAGFPIKDIERELSDFYAQESILIEKKTKKGTAEIDLKSHIYNLKLDKWNNLFSKDSENSDEGYFAPVISMLVDASSSGNIKPMMVVEAFCKFCQVELSPNAFQITRIETYTEVSDEEGKKFVPLEAVGRDS